MAEIILRDLYCYICSLQFDGKLVYDMHQSILHKYKDNGPSFEKLIKTEVSAQRLRPPLKNPRCKFSKFIFFLSNTIFYDI